MVSPSPKASWFIPRRSRCRGVAAPQVDGGLAVGDPAVGDGRTHVGDGFERLCELAVGVLLHVFLGPHHAQVE